MIDMIAFYGARAGTTAPLNVAGVPDTHVTVQGNNVIVPSQCNRLLGLLAMSQATAGSLTNQMQLSSPSLRATTLLDVPCFLANGTVTPANQVPGNDPPYNCFKESPIDLVPGEGLQMLSAVDVAAAAENVASVVTLTDGILACPYTGRIETVIADAQQPITTINQWNPTSIIFRQVLRAGTYAVVGMKFQGVSAIAARLVFGNQGARPGVIACNAPAGAATVGGFAGSKDTYDGLFRYGRAGIFGVFSHTNPPVLEVMSSATDSAAVMHVALDLLKIP